MHLEARSFSVQCTKNYDYQLQFLQVIETKQATAFLRHRIITSIILNPTKSRNGNILELAYGVVLENGH